MIYCKYFYLNRKKVFGLSSGHGHGEKGMDPGGDNSIYGATGTCRLQGWAYDLENP